MSNKTLAITLSHPHINPNVVSTSYETSLYRVEKVINSTDFYPSQMLDKKAVDDICAAVGWNVTIVPVKS